MRIVNTDNFDSDYPDESFVNLPSLDKKLADQLCERINEAWGRQSFTTVLESCG